MLCWIAGGLCVALSQVLHAPGVKRHADGGRCSGAEERVTP